MIITAHVGVCHVEIDLTLLSGVLNGLQGLWVVGFLFIKVACVNREVGCSLMPAMAAEVLHVAFFFVLLRVSILDC